MQQLGCGKWICGKNNTLGVIFWCALPKRYKHKTRVVYHFDTGSLAGIGIDTSYPGTGWSVFWSVL
jgi:hypothetical protein